MIGMYEMYMGRDWENISVCKNLVRIDFFREQILNIKVLASIQVQG